MRVQVLLSVNCLVYEADPFAWTVAAPARNETVCTAEVDVWYGRLILADRGVRRFLQLDDLSVSYMSFRTSLF